MHSTNRIARAGVFTLTAALAIVSSATEVGRHGPVLSGLRLQTPASELLTAATPHAPTRATVQAAYGKLPLHFEANQGQSNEQVQFLARGSGYTLFLTATEAVLALRNAEHMANGRARPKLNDEFKPPHSPFIDHHSSLSAEAVLRMQLVGANPQPHVTGECELPGKSHYFFGNDPAQWYTNIPTYA